MVTSIPVELRCNIFIAVDLLIDSRLTGLFVGWRVYKDDSVLSVAFCSMVTIN
uniref:Uncharacterized protein n=1 Tax=Rhizophagus irregularis (strain DAOM 181602 / DAOM 197198 / MUCL 43194) TaxID=747089 RepID=U9U5L0_RHIID